MFRIYIHKLHLRIHYVRYINENISIGCRQFIRTHLQFLFNLKINVPLEKNLIELYFP